MIDQSDIQTMTDIIVERFAPEKIILFGSYASGTPDDESDVDLIVLKDTGEDPRQVATDIQMALRHVPVAKDILVRTPQQFLEETSVNWTVFSHAVRHGKILYSDEQAA